MDDKIRKILLENDYFMITEVPGRGVCALLDMTFGGAALCIDLNEYGNNGVYQFPDLTEAILSIDHWDGKDHPPGNWCKFKKAGQPEYQNPNYEQVIK